MNMRSTKTCWTGDNNRKKIYMSPPWKDWNRTYDEEKRGKIDEDYWRKLFNKEENKDVLIKGKEQEIKKLINKNNKTKRELSKLKKKNEELEKIIEELKEKVERLNKFNRSDILDID